MLFLEDFGVPVPGEIMLIAAAVFAGAGQMNIAVVFLVAVLAAVIGDNIGFVIGHFGGRPLAERFGRYVFLTPRAAGPGRGLLQPPRRQDRHRRPLHRRAAPDQRPAGRDRRHALAEVPGLQRPGRGAVGGHLVRRWDTSPASTSSRSTTRSSGTSGMSSGRVAVVVAIVITHRVRRGRAQPPGLVVCSRDSGSPAGNTRTVPAVFVCARSRARSSTSSTTPRPATPTRPHSTTARYNSPTPS